ncbi:MAG: hypothetical protein AB3N20_08945 [Rhizobiaceae bacterium]
MNTKTATKTLLAAALAAGLSVSGALAGVPRANQPSSAQAVTLVAGDCYAIGQQVAAQNGGTLAAARAASRGGKKVCVVVVLIPGKNGQRPRRQEIIVPQ